MSKRGHDASTVSEYGSGTCVMMLLPPKLKVPCAWCFKGEVVILRGVCGGGVALRVVMSCAVLCKGKLLLLRYAGVHYGDEEWWR